MIRRRNRNQRGYVYESGSAIYIRFYVTEGTQRVLRAERLCEKDAAHFVQEKKLKSRKNLKTYPSPAVQLKAQEFMLAINSRAKQPATPDLDITTFYKQTYLPWLTESGKRPSTIRGYKQIWKLYLQDHFAGLLLREYKTHHGSQFLTSLAKKLNRTSIAHVRSLASGIFSHAINLGLLERNPWREVKVLTKLRVPEPKGWYTVEEIEAVLQALAGFPAYQLMFALAFYAGLRPEEIAGLRWEDVDADWLRIRQTVVRGHIGECKTERSAAPVPLIDPLRTMLALWWESSKKPTSGWVLPSRRGGPHSALSNTAFNYIRPILLKKDLPWKSLYCGRRGIATELTELTGNAVAAQQLLRHQNLGTTTGVYIQEMPKAGQAGLQLIQARRLELAAKNGK